MTTPSHILSAAYIALIVAGVEHSQTSLILAAVGSTAVVDLDHLYYLSRDYSIAKRGRLYKARSPFHELFGFAMIGVLMLVLGRYNQKLSLVIGLSVMIHLAEDMMVGISIPFSPFDKTEVRLLPQNSKLRFLLDLITILVFGVLWIKYLSG